MINCLAQILILLKDYFVAVLVGKHDGCFCNTRTISKFRSHLAITDPCAHALLCVKRIVFETRSANGRLFVTRTFTNAELVIHKYCILCNASGPSRVYILALTYCQFPYFADTICIIVLGKNCV